MSILTEDDVFTAENGSPADIKVYLIDLRVKIANLEHRAIAAECAHESANHLLVEAEAERDQMCAELAQGVEYVNALVEAMGTDAFLALVDTGKVDGIRAWLETCGEPEEVRADDTQNAG